MIPRTVFLSMKIGSEIEVLGKSYGTGTEVCVNRDPQSRKKWAGVLRIDENVCVLT